MTQQIGRRGLPADEGDEPAAVIPASAARRSADSPAEPADRGPARRGIAPEPRAGARRPWVPLAGLGVALMVGIGGLYLAMDGVGGQAAPSVVASPSASPSATASPGVKTSPLPLDDATLQVPAGWEVYADETVQDDRRLVRLREPATDVRLQAVTLTTVKGSLSTACGQLVKDHEASYTSPAQTPPFTVPVAPGGEGYSCGFRGVRTSDQQQGRVTFTMLRRTADAHTLVLRATVPDAAATDKAAATQLETMTCSAAASFAVDLTRCR